MGRDGRRVLRGLVLGALVVSAAACGGSDDEGSVAGVDASAPVATSSSGQAGEVPDASALAGVVFDVRRDPG
jgi:hypothetical protein